MDGFAVLFPSASPEAETGRKCGTLVLMPGELYEQGMAADRSVFRYRRPAHSCGRPRLTAASAQGRQALIAVRPWQGHLRRAKPTDQPCRPPPAMSPSVPR